MSVRGGVRAVRRDGGVRGAEASRLSARALSEVGRLAHPLAQCLEQRNLEGGALAGHLALIERREHSGESVHPGGDVGDGDTDLCDVVGSSGHRHQTRFALHQKVIRLAISPRTGAAPTGDREHDLAWIARPHRVGADLVEQERQENSRQRSSQHVDHHRHGDDPAQTGALSHRDFVVLCVPKYRLRVIVRRDDPAANR